MKLFLKKFAQVGGVVALSLVLGIGVSVFATDYVGPGAFPANAPVPLNVLETPQMKGYSTDPGLTAILKLNGGLLVGKDSLNVAKDTNTGNLVIGAPGNRAANLGAGNIFGKLFINNYDDDKTSGIKIGGTSLRTATDSLRAALDIDLTGRTGAGSTDGVSVKSAIGAMTSAFITNSQVFHFYSDMVGRDARLYAGSVKLSEYSPANGKILASGDSNGNAVWSTFNPGSMDVKYVSVVDHDSGNPRVNKAYCPSGYVAIGGGGDCQHGDIRHSRPIKGSPNGGDWTWSTMPETNTDTGAGNPANIQANGWMINCGDDNSDGDIHVDVICLKAAAPSFTVPTPTAVSAVGTGSGTGTTTSAGVCGYNASKFYTNITQFNSRPQVRDCTNGTRSAVTITPDADGEFSTATWTCGTAPAAVSCRSTIGVGTTTTTGTTTGGSGGGGCFLADTRVTMSDGSKKAIQDIKVGDELKSVDGKNKVQALIRPKLGDQQVYSINGSKAFFTANHAFLTTKGWKALDVEGARRESRLGAQVTKLAVGDVILTEKGSVKVSSISSVSADASTQLYNFKVDGDHTYFANDYAVHNTKDAPYEPAACSENNPC